MIEAFEKSCVNCKHVFERNNPLCDSCDDHLSNFDLNRIAHVNISHEDDNKKMWYQVFKQAEGKSSGWVYLTKSEAEIVRYATSEKNWDDAKFEPYSGWFYIDLEGAKENLYNN